MKSLSARTKPIVWKFMDCLKLEQALTDQKIADYHNKRDPLRCLTQWIEYDRTLNDVLFSF